MKDTVDRIEGKLDKISDRLNSIDVTLAKQEITLDIHVKRTNLLESKIDPMESRWSNLLGVIKLVGFIAVLAGIGEAATIIIKGLH